MASFPLVVSYYTPQYQEEAQNLLFSCRRFGLEYAIEKIDSRGSWELNCAYKPLFLLEKLVELQRPLIWVDADSVFLQQPSFLPVFASDLAVRINFSLPIEDNSHTLSGTVYVNYTQGASQLLMRWNEEIKRKLIDPARKEEMWDQTALRDVLLTPPSNTHVGSLPLVYAKIYDDKDDVHLFGEPVIQHNQASRRLKKIVNKKAIDHNCRES